MPQTSTKRDLTLDIAKGLAIILVVAGHMLEGASPDFDETLPFRAIYAFHMPLFVFLAGAVAALKPPPAMAPGLGWRTRVSRALQAMGHSAKRLMIPFATWTVIGWYVSRRETTSLPDWLVMVYKSTDNSLWFLALIFECLCIWHLWHLGIALLCDALRRKGDGKAAAVIARPWVSLISCIVVFALILFFCFVPHAFGLGAVKEYLGFFLLGALYYLYGRDYPRGVARVIPYILFISLVPFWYRLHPGAVSLALGNYINLHVADRCFHLVVALAGIFMALDIVKLIRATKFELLERFLAYCGVASLGIYAMHYYLLDYPPPVIMPLLMCLAAYAVLSRIPVLRVIFLGETGKMPPKIKLSSFWKTDKS